MEVLFVAAEAYPFIKKGGLGDVSYALSKELNSKGIKTKVVLPYYKSIKDRNSAEFICNFNVFLSWRQLYCGVFREIYDGIEYYFIDNEYYFYRDNIYGDYDDGERFAFFSKAVLEMLQKIDYAPDIIHANDWQCAFVPLFFNGFFRHIDFYARIKTMFTIHNIEYQGKVPESFLKEVLGMDDYFMQYLYNDGCINLMHGAIRLSDKVTTVSETYSHEIKHDYFGKGLSGVLKQEEYKLLGITNGIDTKTYNPKTDMALSFNYSSQNQKGKAKCKTSLQKELGLAEDEDIAVVSVISRLVPHKGLDLVKCVLEDILKRHIQLIVVGTGYPEYEHMFWDFASRYSGRVSANIVFDETLARKVYSASDLFLMPSQSEPCGLSQMIAMRYGAVPIVRETGGLCDTVKPVDYTKESGNGITFKTYNAHDMLDALDRALKLFYDDKDLFMKIRQNNMETDFSWNKPSEKYIEVYESI